MGRTIGKPCSTLLCWSEDFSSIPCIFSDFEDSSSLTSGNSNLQYTIFSSLSQYFQPYILYFLDQGFLLLPRDILFFFSLKISTLSS